MPGQGLIFLQEIRDEIARCDRLILMVGPDAMASDYAWAEWHFAQVMSKPVILVLCLDDFDLQPKVLKNIDCRDFR